MSTVTSKIVAHVAVGITPSNQFLLRFVVSSLLTGFDAAMLLTVGRFVYRSASISLVLPAAFVILTLGMIASLAHTWILTIRVWNCQQSIYGLTQLVCPTKSVPADARQTGMEGVSNGTRKKTYAGANREPASAD
jgi:hypothetical protein